MLSIVTTSPFDLLLLHRGVRKSLRVTEIWFAKSVRFPVTAKELKVMATGTWRTSQDPMSRVGRAECRAYHMEVMH